MKFATLLFLALNGFGQTDQTWPTIDKSLESEIRAVMKIENDLVLRSDTAGMNAFYPDDMVTYNPFNQIINKAKVLERVRANIIKYTSYEKKIQYLHSFDGHVVVMGTEVVKPAPNSDRPDAGKVMNRTFTEVWVRRGNTWKKIIRHSSNIDLTS